jgi:CubicO group peptidase (beta-lactamase class C family)
MTFMRSATLALWLASITSAAAISTPVRDLSQETITESQCDWPNFQEDDDLNGVMVLYRGHKLAEWRNPIPQNNDWFYGQNYIEGTTQHAQYSVTKTWISVLVGMLYRDGFLDWETEHPDKITLGDIFPEKVWDDIWDIPFPISGGSKVPELKAITLGELMSMRTGYAENGISSPFDSTLVRDLDRLIAWWHPLYRKGRIESQTCFNCGDYLSSSGIVNYIIKEKTKTAANPRGWDPLDYARQTTESLPNGNVGLFEALGMEQGSYTWDRDRDDVARGAFGLWMDLEDMAKFGQLLLQGGSVMFDGVVRDIVPSYYLEEMTKTQSRMFGTDFPYGWQVWNWGEDDDGESGFCAEGLGWQSVCVFPKHETVVAIQAPVSFGVATFEANIEFRNDAIKAIRDGIVCGPTSSPGGSPTTPTLPPVSTSAPTSGGNLIGDTIQDPINGGSIGEGDFINGNDNTNGNNDADGIDSENESEVFIGSANGDDDGNAPVGWIVTSVLLSAIFCVFCALFLCAKRNKKDQAAPRSVDCKIIPTSQDDELNKMYEAKLHADDLSVDTDDESGEIAYAVADIEQRSS